MLQIHGSTSRYGEWKRYLSFALICSLGCNAMPVVLSKRNAGAKNDNMIHSKDEYGCFKGSLLPSALNQKTQYTYIPLLLSRWSRWRINIGTIYHWKQKRRRHKWRKRSSWTKVMTRCLALKAIPGWGGMVWTCYMLQTSALNQASVNVLQSNN